MEMEIIRFLLAYVARKGDVNESRQAIQYVESLKQFDITAPAASDLAGNAEAVAEQVKESVDA